MRNYTEQICVFLLELLEWVLTLILSQRSSSFRVGKLGRNAYEFSLIFHYVLFPFMRMH